MDHKLAIALVIIAIIIIAAFVFTPLFTMCAACFDELKCVKKSDCPCGGLGYSCTNGVCVKNTSEKDSFRSRWARLRRGGWLRPRWRGGWLRPGWRGRWLRPRWRGGWLRPGWRSYAPAWNWRGYYNPYGVVYTSPSHFTNHTDLRKCPPSKNPPKLPLKLCNKPGQESWEVTDKCRTTPGSGIGENMEITWRQNPADTSETCYRIDIPLMPPIGTYPIQWCPPAGGYCDDR